MSIYKRGRPAVCAPFSEGRDKLPKRPGEYRILTAGGEIVYVGETNNISRRVGEHMRSGKLSETERPKVAYMVADGRSSSRTRRRHEREKIAKHNPPLNRSAGGEGRPAKR